MTYLLLDFPVAAEQLTGQALEAIPPGGKLSGLLDLGLLDLGLQRRLQWLELGVLRLLDASELAPRHAKCEYGNPGEHTQCVGWNLRVSRADRCGHGLHDAYWLGAGAGAPKCRQQRPQQQQSKASRRYTEMSAAISWKKRKAES
jgi:hypothetical protein